MIISKKIKIKAIIMMVSALIFCSCEDFMEDFIFAPITMFNLENVGYELNEYFISGTADSYLPVGELTPDGKWNVVTNQQADYTTRILVITPIDPEKFNGTVIVEWNNVSGNTDASPDWIMAHTEFIREGYAWVGVTAQRKGIDNVGTFGLFDDVMDASLKNINPVRYSVLSHPGDSFSYSIFTQAAQKVREGVDVDYLKGLEIERMIAAGESQSAARLMSYINMFAKSTGVFDGFLVHSRVGSSSVISEEPLETVAPPDIVTVRDDLTVPVLMVQTETDLFFRGDIIPSTAYASRQPDSDMFRLWELAGASHADVYSVYGMFDAGRTDRYAQLIEASSPIPGIVTCSSNINGSPAHHFMVNAAFHALDQWIRTDIPPKSADRIEVDAHTLEILRDDYGNALGGVRSPYIDVPTASFTPISDDEQILCATFGSMVLFTDEELHGIYPSPRDYMKKVRASTKQAVSDGYLRPKDAELVISAARSFSRNLR